MTRGNVPLHNLHPRWLWLFLCRGSCCCMSPVRRRKCPFIHCWQEVSFSLRSHDETGEGWILGSWWQPTSNELIPALPLGHCWVLKEHLPEFFLSERGKLFSNQRCCIFDSAQLFPSFKFLLSGWLLGRVQGCVGVCVGCSPNCLSKIAAPRAYHRPWSISLLALTSVRYYIRWYSDPSLARKFHWVWNLVLSITTSPGTVRGSEQVFGENLGKDSM